MPKEKEYILRGDAQSAICTGVPADKRQIDAINAIPAADVVEVVRCEKCARTTRDTTGEHIFCPKLGKEVSAKFFCADGRWRA